MRLRRAVLVTLAVVAALSLLLSSGCTHGPRVRGGNLKEKRLKKRALIEAQQQALEEERRREMDARGESPPAQPQPVPDKPGELPEEDVPLNAMPASAKPAPAPAAPEESARLTALEPDYSRDRCRVTLRHPDGSEETRLLYQPAFGYTERTFRTSGGVVDHEHSMPMFRFQVGLSLHKVKFVTLDRVEFLDAADTRTKLRLLFHFRKGRKPEEFPAEQLLGAAHPQVPFLQGVGTSGLERYALFHITGDAVPLRIVEIDFTP